MRLLLSALALVVTAPLAAATGAGEQTVTVRVSYADIDLSNAEGRAALEARVDAKLREACTLEANSRYGYGRDIVDQKCVTEARTVALAEVERIAAAERRAGGQVAAN
jgi:UrcA family protein